MKHGDTKTNEISICIPANIRYRHYETLEELKLENKFAPVAVVIPLKADLKESLSEVPKETSQIKKKFSQVYAMYSLSYFSAMFCPAFLNSIILDSGSLPYTLAFSNVPGLLKPVPFNGSKSKKDFGYFIPGGKAGIGICAVSYCEHFKITCLLDTSLKADPKEIIELIEINISKCIKDAESSEVSEYESSPRRL